MSTTTRRRGEYSLRTRLAGVDSSFVAGALFFGFALVAMMGIITAEAFYPGYNAGVQEISDLGATRPPNSVILQPAATIFNTTMLVSGLLVVGGTYFVHRAFGDRAMTAVLALLGIGLLGVGFFDGSEAPMHGMAAMLTFVAGGVSAVVAARIIRTPFRYVSVAVGAFVLLLIASLIGFGITAIPHPMAPLGAGGIERYVAYPTLLWFLGFAGYLMAPTAGPESAAADGA
jgi:hypothetical membrane protein